jgi:hypothetical protein
MFVGKASSLTLRRKIGSSLAFKYKLTVTNALAYCNTKLITTVKCSVAHDPDFLHKWLKGIKVTLFGVYTIEALVK